MVILKLDIQVDAIGFENYSLESGFNLKMVLSIAL